jgi:hypothetical protein
MTAADRFTESEKKRIIARYQSGITIEAIRKSWVAGERPGAGAIRAALKEAKVYLTPRQWRNRFCWGRG